MRIRLATVRSLGVAVLALAAASADRAALVPVPPLAPPTAPPTAPTLAPSPTRAATLQAEHAALQSALRDSVFGEPLVLTSRDDGERDEGEVVAEVPRPLAQLAELFKSAASVCDLLFLHLNVRACKPGGSGNGQTLEVSAGPMREMMHGLVYRIGFTMRSELPAAPSYLDASFDAAQGPLGTRDIHLRIEAVPTDASRSFIRVGYAYESSVAARLANRLYLSTAGRSKIGFSVLGLGADGQPRYAGGQRAALERNVMRHYLGLLAYTGVSTGTPAERMEARLRAWHALTEDHAPQLHELDLADYLHEKHDALVRYADGAN